MEDQGQGRYPVQQFKDLVKDIPFAMFTTVTAGGGLRSDAGPDPGVHDEEVGDGRRGGHPAGRGKSSECKEEQSGAHCHLRRGGPAGLYCCAPVRRSWTGSRRRVLS